MSKTPVDAFVAQAFESTSNMRRALDAAHTESPAEVIELAAEWGITLTVLDALAIIGKYHDHAAPGDPTLRVC
jgi:hypothetical protein